VLEPAAIEHIGPVRRNGNTVDAVLGRTSDCRLRRVAGGQAKYSTLARSFAPVPATPSNTLIMREYLACLEQ
jgi:hypothetical protein